MTKIKLKSICLRNFKKVHYLLLNLDGRNTNITGANGSGKTTIYKAYYWCLTGKTLEPNEIIQMLDENNNIIHKQETSVQCTFLIDGSYEITVERRLTEDWRALGQPNEELKGTKQSRFINEVPFSLAEFNAKLNSICEIEKWLLLTDINHFMSLKMEERRKLLIGIAGDINEMELASNYPEVLDALKCKKSVEELKIQSLSTKKRANEELKTIPSQIDAQDRLKSDEDFEALRKEKDSLDLQISDIDKLLQGSTEELQVIKQYNDKVSEAKEKLHAYKRTWDANHNKEIDTLSIELQKARKTLNEAIAIYEKKKSDNDARISQKIALSERFNNLRQQWNTENAKEFSFDKTESCPYCGHIFTEEEKSEKKATAISIFNQHKAEVLKKIQTEAEQVNERILILTGSINEYDKVISRGDKNAVDAKEMALNEVQTKYNALLSTTIDNDSDYKALLVEVGNAIDNKPTLQQDNKENETLKCQLMERRETVIMILAKEHTNRKIEEEKLRLENRSNELANIISKCDKTLFEITQFKKEMVDTVESKVNSFFTIARWKFYEKNVTNDELKEVCVCHHNGIDFNSTNFADKIALSIDIVKGLSKAFEVEVPLFVDQKESIANIMQTPMQMITLEHVKDAQFNINFI